MFFFSTVVYRRLICLLWHKSLWFAIYFIILSNYFMLFTAIVCKRRDWQPEQWVIPLEFTVVSMVEQRNRFVLVQGANVYVPHVSSVLLIDAYTVVISEVPIIVGTLFYKLCIYWLCVWAQTWVQLEPYGPTQIDSSSTLRRPTT